MLTKTQLTILRFLRKHELSAAQLFLMWRHYPDKDSCAKVPELALLPPSAFRTLPTAPGPVSVFSAAELEVVLRLANISDTGIRNKGWALINRCAWERLFPESFSEKVAGRILIDASEATNLSAWVDGALQPRHLYYARCVELLAVDVCRTTSSYQVCDDDFKEFLAINTRTTMKPKR